MSEINYKKVMLDMIGLLLEGRWTVPEFEAAYYMFNVEILPEKTSLTDYDLEFFNSVREALDWASEYPDPTERQYRHIDHKEYLSYVSRLLDLYKAGKSLEIPRL